MLSAQVLREPTLVANGYKVVGVTVKSDRDVEPSSQGVSPTQATPILLRGIRIVILGRWIGASWIGANECEGGVRNLKHIPFIDYLNEG